MKIVELERGSPIRSLELEKTLVFVLLFISLHALFDVFVIAVIVVCSQLVLADHKLCCIWCCFGAFDKVRVCYHVITESPG